MSTTTTNFGLVKPELTDAADITAMNPNWDTIDEELVNLQETIDNFESSDLTYTELVESVTGEAPEIDPVVKNAINAVSNDVAVVNDALNNHVSDKNNPHSVTAQQVGALPLSGGTLSGNLHINKTFPIHKLANSDNNYSLQLQMSSDKTGGMYNIKDSDNATGIYITDTIESPERAVRLSHKYKGTANYYNIFGEHNTSLLASNLQTLIANGGMSTLQSAIQVTNSVLSSTSSTFSGTGKGRLFIASSNTVTAAVTIDGTSIGTGHGVSAFEVEFLNSFSVKGNSSSSLYCTAVFY